MDGTLLDTERLSMRAFAQAAHDLHIHWPDEHYLQLVGRPGPDSQRFIADLFGCAQTATRFFEEADRNYRILRETEGIPLKPGCKEILALADRLGLPRAIATSTRSPLAQEKLTATGLLEGFTVIVTGDEVIHGKPAPDIYLLAAERLGTDPTACLAFEDSPRGVEAAHAAAMDVLMVPDLIPADEHLASLATAVVPDLFAAADILRERVRAD